MLIDQRFGPPSGDRAYEIIAAALGRRAPVEHVLRDYPDLAVVTALIDLEQTFAIALDVDEAYCAGTVGGLLDLVSLKTGLNHAAQPCALYDLASYRQALGLTAFGADRPLILARECVDAAFPPAPISEDAPPAKPGKRRLTLKEVVIGLGLGLILALVADGWAESRLAHDTPSAAALALADAVR